MKVSNNIRYPHPVVDESNDDFHSILFSCNLEMKSEVDPNSGEIRINYQLELGNTELNNLIQEESARACLMIECGATFYRDLKFLSVGDGLVSIDANNLYKTVEITPIVYASKRIEEYCPSGVHPEYGEAVFTVRSGDALALAPTQKYSIGNEKENRLESVFKFVTDDELDDYELQLSVGGEYIEIATNSYTRECIEEYRISNQKKAILLNAVYFPVIVGVLSEMTKDLASDLPELSGKRWFEAFVDLAEEQDFSIDKDSNPFEVAQKILKSPLRILFNAEETETV